MAVAVVVVAVVAVVSSLSVPVFESMCLSLSLCMCLHIVPHEESFPMHGPRADRQRYIYKDKVCLFLILKRSRNTKIQINM